MDIRQSAVLSVFLLCTAFTASASELGMTFGAENFRWREYDAGDLLLEEAGPRLRVGLDWQNNVGAKKNILLQVRSAAYVGSVDYDGMACDTTDPTDCIPFKTDTDYRGITADVTAAHRFGLDSGAELFYGAGFDRWRREIQGKANVSGAVEDWLTMYLLAGAGGYSVKPTSRSGVRAGIKYPFHSSNAAADVTLEPKGKTTLFARFAMDFLVAGKPRWGFGFNYDKYQFDTSDAEPIGGGFVIFQPESRQETYGAFVKYYFR